MSFDRFFQEEHDGLLRFCWLLTLEREAAADVAQETMVRAWKAWPKLSEPGNNPSGWVRTVAANLARSRWRRIRRAADFGHRYRAETVGTADRVADPALVEALGALSDRQREAVVLRYWADLRLADCAAAMGITEGSAKQHLARAHARLGQLLDSTMLEEMTL